MLGRPLLAGGILLNQMKVCSERFGQPVVDDVVNGLSQQERDVLTSLLPVSWVDTELSERLLDGVAVRTGRDSEVLFREVVSTTVERQFKTVWRAILHFTSDAALVSRTPLIYSKTYNAGTLVSEIPAPGRVRAVVSGWPNDAPRQMLGLSHGIATVLRIAGRKQVEITYTARPGGAEFHGTWKV